MSVVIETTFGDVTVDLYVKERHQTCLNFLKLCKVRYYNNCLFHQVQRNFITQTGDPTGTGRGGESIYRMIYGDQAKFYDAEKVPKIKHKQAGLLSMVNDGNGMHGSQFLITLADNLDSLDGVHTVFGEVAEGRLTIGYRVACAQNALQIVSGMETVMKINEAFCDNDGRPYQDIRITHTIILDDPFDDPKGLIVPDHSPEPSRTEIEGCFRIGADESINDDEEELKERESKKEAHHNAQVLEIIGDIPDKDVKPPDNVLFVCKLNSVTTDEDLEIIFSRFGTIVSCEIIRDYKTGDSLQYAFIEFEDAEMCEKAYKKMDNVLIDDRRIHVDFSQSVSKLKFPRSNKVESTEEPPRYERDNGRPRNSKHRERDRTARRRDISPQRHRDISPQRHRDISPRRHRDVSPVRHREHFESQHDRRHHRRSPFESSRHRDRTRDKHAKHEKREKKSKKRRYENDDDRDFSDREVRCGKHRKKSAQRD